MASYYYSDKQFTGFKCFLCFEPLAKASLLGKYNHIGGRLNTVGRNCPWYNSSCFELGGFGFAPARRIKGSKTKKFFPKEVQEYFEFLDSFNKTDFARHLKVYL